MHTTAKAESWAWLTTVDWQLCMRQSRIDGVIPTSAESGRHTHIRIRFTRVTMPISQDFSQYTRCGSVMAENVMGWLRTKMQLARSNMLLARGQQSPTSEGGEYLPASTYVYLQAKCFSNFTCLQFVPLHIVASTCYSSLVSSFDLVPWYTAVIRKVAGSYDELFRTSLALL